MKHPVVLAIVSFAVLLLPACSALQTGEAPPFLDRDFAAPAVPVRAADVFALSDDMKRYLATDIARESHNKGPQQALVDALYDQRQLRLEYDSVLTRNAAETFRDRRGNCLSLVIMTAAFAKAMGMEVRYQSVAGEESWARGGGMHLALSHVNLTLARPQVWMSADRKEVSSLTVDFIPPAENEHPLVRPIDENTVVALYMNNRAAESLVAGRLDEAYWFAREAILQDSRTLGFYLTLGVIYRRHGQPQAAENVLRYVLARDPDDTKALTNLIVLLTEQGREPETHTLSARLDRLQPDPPYRFFELGMAAMQHGEFRAAQSWFERELGRDPYNHEFHFWLAMAHLRLGETAKARAHLDVAVEYSATAGDRALYAAKLDKLNAQLNAQPFKPAKQAN